MKPNKMDGSVGINVLLAGSPSFLRILTVECGE